MKNSFPVALSLVLMCLVACTYTLKIKDGKTAYDRKQYAVAAKFFEKEYSKGKSRVEKGKAAFLLGESLKQIHNDGKAATWYKNAYDNGFGADALKEYAYALKRQEQYKEAADAFKELGAEIGSPYEYRREIAACNTSLGWIDDAKYTGYAVAMTEFNSPNADFSPAIYEGGKVVFSSDRGSSTGEATYAWTGNRFADLFLVDNNAPQNFDNQLNTPFNEATAAFTGDFSEMFFTRSGGENVDEQFTKIFYSKKIGNSWTTPEVLPFCRDRINYSTPSVSKDGKTLFFASNDGEGWGGLDLYTVARTSEGFVEPRILPRSLNTVGNEAYPHLDGDTLYFASDYHLGMGGWDVFKSTRLKDGNWTTPTNLKSPVNSGADDFGFVVDNVSALKEGFYQQGYFASNRTGGKGSDDVYRFERGTPPPRPVVIKPDTPKVVKKIEYKNTLDVIVLEKIYQFQDNPNSKVLGKKPLTEAKVTINIGGKKREMTTNTEGVVSIDLEDNADYIFLGAKEGFLNNQTTFSAKGLGKDPNNPIQNYEVEIVLDKIFKDREIVLENIYYDYDKWDIRADAQPTLNKLAETLAQNPQVKIQLNSHTDCRGNDTYNATLSQKRAESAVNYLISKGIDAARLGAKGYGESLPTMSCACNKCSEDEHQANRRTAFKIVE